MMNKETKQEKNKTNSGAKYCYIRVSEKKQKIDRQVDFFTGYEIPKENIFVDKQSGKDFNRPAYKKLFRKLKPGDTLYIKELDRLGRNKDEIKSELSRLQNKKVHVRIANIPTTMQDFGEADWVLDMVNNILVEVLAAVAEQERIMNHKRQAEGIAAAKSRGVHMGRPIIELPENFAYYHDQWRSKKMKRAEILEALNIDAIKFYTYARSYENHLKK